MAPSCSSCRVLRGYTRRMTDVDEKDVISRAVPKTIGHVLHSPALYDLLAWLFMRGREGEFRDTLVDLARLTEGESVLDVGCGTGTLAIAAKRRVGPRGSVYGIDASPEMIVRATKKARQQGAEIAFRSGVVEVLPYPDARFDAVLSTLMLHHLPRKARQQCAREMRRVLKPGGRVLAVDFGAPDRPRKGLLSHFHRHGHVALDHIIDDLRAVGLNVVESGAVGVKDLQFALAQAAANMADRDPRPMITTDEKGPASLAGVWMIGAALILLVGHAIALFYGASHLGLTFGTVLGLAGLVVANHLGWLGSLIAFMRRSVTHPSR